MQVAAVMVVMLVAWCLITVAKDGYAPVQTGEGHRRPALGMPVAAGFSSVDFSTVTSLGAPRRT